MNSHPDVTSVTGETTPYQTVSLHDDVTATRGTASGTQVGVSRARTIEYTSGTAGNTDAVYKLFLFDIRPFTYLTLSGTPSATLLANHSNGGVQVKGVTSGATGYVWGALTSGTIVVLTNVSGNFSSGEKITASDSAETDSIVEDSGNTDLTISNIVIHKFNETRSVFMDDADSGQDFTADLVLERTSDAEGGIVIDGTDANTTDVNDNIVLEEDNSTTLALESEQIGKLVSSEKNIAIYRLSKRAIKTLLTATNAGASDTQITLRKQFIGTTNSAGAVSFTAGANETFSTFVEKDYTLTVLTAGSGTSAQGDVVSIDGNIGGTGSATITITDNTLFGNAAKVKLTATILKTNITQKVKTTLLSKQVKVAGASTAAFGTRATDKTISLGRADAYRLGVVYDSEDTSTDAVSPTLTLTSVSGTFLRGEKITGGTSGAIGKVISPTSPIGYYLQNGNGSTDFVATEIITGDSSGATATISSKTDGDKIITSNYTLDTGQRDNYYDISRIILKPGSSTPRGRVLVVFDYLSHGGGAFFTVDSYSDQAGQMQYDDIPTYSATRVDPDEPEPTGEFDLTDCLDFRPTVEDVAGASNTNSAIDTITGNSFDFYHRQFDGSGASTVDTPKPSVIGTLDFEYYLNKVATVFLTPDGEFKVIEGISAEVPNESKDIDNAMKLAKLTIPAYTFRPTDVIVERFKTQRFTMRDIGKLQKRIQNLEYYTNLTLLERDAESFEIQDANGLNRYKSGFIVDNFSGHRVGDVKNKDYQNSIDYENKELRPKAIMRNASLVETVSTDSARSSLGYQKTGDLLTLPYTEETLTENPYATRTEKVQPVITSQWVGMIELSPSGDEWFETETAPDLIVNVDGNYDSVLAANQNRLGTVWNAWQTQWSGVVSTTVRLDTAGNTRAIQAVRTDLRRSGTQTNIAEQIDEESQGTKVISRALIPWVRPRSGITFTGTGFLPNTKVYTFLDGTAMSGYVTPETTEFTLDSVTPTKGVQLVTSANGSVNGSFDIPSYSAPGEESNPKFKTGELEFRITSNSTNIKSPQPSTAGNTTYVAKGILETEQETIIATRNAIIVQSSMTETTTQMSQNVRVTRRQNDQMDNQGPNPDPLAQTFIIDRQGGCFLTSVDLYFETKDNVLPAWIEIRNVNTGYPGAKIIPFSRKVLQSADINISSTAATATTFTFKSPVYLKEGAEYCLVVRSNSLDYKVWISRMGETDIDGLRVVSKQPHLGVLFKSQNNRTWSAVQSEDLKFTIKSAIFNTSAAGNLTLQNDNIGDAITNELGTTVYGKRLKPNSLTLTNGSTVLKVKHIDHGMYTTSNNVRITGVSSGISTTLSSAITTSATTLTLASATGFATGSITVKIDNEIITGSLSGTTLSSLTRGIASSTAAAHTAAATIEFYQILGTPLTEINKTHTAIANIGLDSYTVGLTTAPTISGGSTTAEVGGISIYASENYRYETVKSIVGSIELPDTSITATLRNTTGTSPSGTETSFTTTTVGNAVAIPFNENHRFETTNLIASDINETNELAGSKSLFMPLKLGSTNINISPVIDLDRSSIICVGNRLNNIDSSSDVYPTTDYNASTAAEGDQNAFIYITKKVALENSATALKVIFSGHKPQSADIKVLYKLLRTDDASNFDELGYEYFNTDGSPDATVGSSLDDEDYQEYKFTAGVTDDGIGTPLPEFVQFAIKIVGQGTNAARSPRVRDLRCIALAT